MIRILDVLISTMALLLLFPILILILLLAFLDTGSPLFRQKRVGRYQQPFTLIKFRTMDIGTESVASHLVGASSVTKLGKFLRKSKLDELPQLWNVLIGDMSLVGPRPCLYNQIDLINEREKLQVFSALPGITGLAQLNHIDMSIPARLAEVDAKMIKTLSLKMYFKCIFFSVLGKGAGDRVKQDI